jgi:peptidoglycan/xylan/chitin deacetylase (PgdA/CDA1 family)
MRKLCWGLLCCLLILTAGCVPVNVAADSKLGNGGLGGEVVTVFPSATITPSPTLIPTLTQTPFTPSTPVPSPTPTLTPDPNLTFTGPGPVLAPVLMYHHVKPYSTDSEYVVSVDQFKRQVQWLKDEGYQTITITDLVEAIRYGKYLPHKPIIVTFDDGYLDVYQNAYPILQEAGYTATMYLIENAINDHGYISDAIIEELSTAGWEFGNHSATHAYLPSSKNMEDEVCASRARLIEKYDLPFDSFAYPYAAKDEGSIQAVKDCGYTSGAGNGSFTIHVEERNFFLSRREIKSYFDMQRFITTVTDLR